MVWQDGNHFIFEVRCDGASEVFLAGDFNHWLIPGKPMHEVRPGIWQTRCHLPVGTQRVGYFAVTPRPRTRPPGSFPAPDDARWAGRCSRGLPGASRCEATFDACWLNAYDCVHVEEHEAYFAAAH
jgi:hypothetical protein